MTNIKDIARKRILILDGAMGTMIQRENLQEADFYGQRFEGHPIDLKGNNDLLSITRPDIIKKIHAAYFEAGADIVETNTFSSTSIAQADYQLEDAVYELNEVGARIAKEVAREWTDKDPSKPRFVAGSIGPTNRTCSMSPDVNSPAFRAVDFNQLKEAYKEQVEGLAAGGVDLFLVETVFDTLNAKAALFAIDEFNEQAQKPIPTMVSGTITDASGRTLSGQTPEAFYISLRHADLFSIGFNCALGADQLKPHIQELNRISDCLISAHPNAGLPNELGAYDQTPEQMKDAIKPYLASGWINIIGGCCGTTPEHIHAIAECAKQFGPRINETQTL